ncbi:ATP-binding protein [Streptosporangium sp. G11]|uniref:ATP-binding protein n=1 Tax=Streptosporangium sp. G11 TaxID=3436926 RepID=UPI003EBA78C6
MSGGRPFWKIWAGRTGSASAGDHSVVVTGVANFGAMPATPSPSGYLQRVRQVFPGVLVGRETELAELAAFCAVDRGPAYVWWQGEAWAGKTALMASFVLAPPAGVRVVSFFITARWAGQSDRGAFLGSVLPQLSQITGESLPDVLTEAHRHEWFLRLMDDAARLCAVGGGRLVLVVDGLDEDRGVTTGADAHSIAALLPASPSHGARVVVAGRPNPPVPSDVPDWHPLRDPQIVRPLTAVPAAVVARREAERELLHLVDAKGLGRELLGLLTASGGGLSGQNLAELAGVSVWEVERVLRAVTGRTFTGRDSTWQPEPDRLFVLAHEELMQTALHCLSGDLDEWQDRIHVWADGHRDRGWPAGTPEYLLRGYLPMLLKVGDVRRMTALATDRARIDRMLDVSGGDAAAMADITAIQEYIRDQPHPDLTATLHLAYTREYITQRNSNIPENLPALWAMLGNPTRAEALAQSVTGPVGQVKALTSLMGAVAETGDLGRARSLSDQAETIARTIADPSQQASALTSLANTVAKTGDLDAARRLLVMSLITVDPNSALQALAVVAPQAVLAVTPDWLGVES